MGAIAAILTVTDEEGNELARQVANKLGLAVFFGCAFTGSLGKWLKHL